MAETKDGRDGNGIGNHDANDANDAGDAGRSRTLSLVKGQHRFCFRYQTGDEPKVLDALVEMVNRRDLSFDWFDAAVLSHQLGQHLAKELKAYLPKKAA